uniref:pyridoxal-phosphate-dependent aminotransferase family protein n=1 Tax=Pararhizobium sp. IMCC3301 TaxID=3067904 RepID=UPI0027405419|nr:aminotransferase class V-fold PLP-dependent enzyme [Pararhizobium sp. IMCC3301]
MTSFSKPLASGPQIQLIPGPSILPDRVRAAMHCASIDIYSGPLLDVTARCEAGLRGVFETSEPVFLYAANGHGAWDAALSNTLCRGEKILVLQSGRFAVGWGEMASAMGLQVEILSADWHSAVNPEALSERLKADKAHTIRAILCVQVDTASGVSNDVGELRQAIDVVGHPALLMVDAVASLGTMPFEFQKWGVDVAVSASQKGLMSAPGLGFVAASQRALEAHKCADLRTRYWDWSTRNGTNHYQKYCGTPPEQLLFGLAEAFDMMAEEGLSTIFKRHELLKQATQSAISSWHDVGAIANIPVQKNQASSVSVFNLPDGLAGKVISFCRENCGVTLGGGLGRWSGKSIRIGHMGHINAPTLLGAIGCIDLALNVLGLDPSQYGAAAAVRALGRGGEDPDET